MSLTGHLAELERKHDALDKKIAQELMHPHQDAKFIVELKRKKLNLKDQITKLKADPQKGDNALH
jgi:hypothetical protein